MNILINRKILVQMIQITCLQNILNANPQKMYRYHFCNKEIGIKTVLPLPS